MKIFRKRKKFDGKVNISLKKVYIAIVLLFSIVFIATHYDRPSPKPVGEYGNIGSAEIEEFVNELKGGGSVDADSGDSGADSGAGDILSQVPDYSEVQRPAYALNDNHPWFTEEDYVKAESMYIELSELDYLGRCGRCEASLGEDTLAGDRDFDLSHVTPSGWNQAQYEDLIDNDGWVYNRCHLIMYAVSGITDDPRNLVTGTRYMNVEGQLPYAEKATQNYIIRKAKGGRILYRATPIYSGLESVCRGVHIEAGDVETRGENFHINVFCYNVQPGIGIDYFTGKTWRE